MQQSKQIPRNIFAALTKNPNADLIEVKLPSSMRIQMKAFDAQTYDIEDPIQFVNDKGQLIDKACPVDNIIRWRYASDQTKDEGEDIHNPELDAKCEFKVPQNRRIESNAKIVQWSDGTYSLAIGDEFFEMSIESLTQRQCFTSFKDAFALYKGSVNKRMIVKPPQSYRSQKRFIKRIHDAQKNVTGANITHTDNQKKLVSGSSLTDRKATNQAPLKNQLHFKKEIEDQEESNDKGVGQKRTHLESKQFLESDEEEKTNQNKKRQKIDDQPLVNVQDANMASGSEEEYVSKDMFDQKNQQQYGVIGMPGQIIGGVQQPIVGQGIGFGNQNNNDESSSSDSNSDGDSSSSSSSDNEGQQV